MKKILIVIFSVSLVFGAPIELSIGARASGMGGAFVGLADDAYSNYYNPAGLINLASSQVAFMHWMYPEIKEVMIDYATLAYPVPLMGTKMGFGFSWLRQGAKLEDFFGNSSTMSENYISLTISMQILRNLSFGLNLNRFLLNSVVGSKSGWGFDLGIQSRVTPMVKVGAVVKNFAAGYADEKILPTYRAGLALLLFPEEEIKEEIIKKEGKTYLKRIRVKGKERVILALDLGTKRNINGKDGMSFVYFAGAEIHWIPQFALRFGTSYNYPFSVGIGLYFRNIGLNYSYSANNKWLKDAHKISINFTF